MLRPAAVTPEERRAAANARQQRYRDRQKAHADGRHDECNPRSCEEARAAASEGGDAGQGVTRDVTAAPKNSVPHRDPPADMGERGRRLWDDMARLKLGPTHVLLLERACRKADRLEQMDAALRGRGWFDLITVPDTDGAVVQMVVDKLLSEIRQTEVALKLDVAELRHAARPAVGTAGLPAGREADDNDDDEPEAKSAGNVRSISDIISRPAQGG